jgi:Chaperone of endosialidase
MNTKFTPLFFGLLLLLAVSTSGQTGIGTTTPNSWLDVRGAMSTAIRIFTGSSSAATTDQTLLFTGSTPATLTLPDAGACTGRIYWIKNASTTLPAPALTINTTASQTIEGIASWLLDEPNETVRIASNGSGWYVYASDIPVVKTSTTGDSWKEGGNILKSLKKIGTTTNIDLPFVTNGTEKMRLTAGGFLGIGSTAPVGRLHFISQNDDAGDNYIFNDYTSTTTQAIFLRKSRGTIAAPLDLQQNDLISQFRFAPHYGGSLPHNDGSGLDAYYMGTGTTNLTDLLFFTSNTEQMRINELGKTGIGTSTFDPTNPEKLKVNAGVTSSVNLIAGKGTYDNYLQLNIWNLDNTPNASSDVVATAANGTDSTLYVDMGINSGVYTNTNAPISGGSNTAYLYSTGNDFVIGNGSAGANLIFFTGGYANTNEAMRITASGSIGIGTTTPADKLDVAGVLAPATDNTYTIGESANRWSFVYAANGVIQTSDERLKTNILPLDLGLEQVEALSPVWYNWKDNAHGKLKVGLIAQEVKKIIPEAVKGDGAKDTLGMDYTELIPVLISTIKMQQSQLEQLKQELASLETPKNHRTNTTVPFRLKPPPVGQVISTK